ncbi:MAG: hypothetical protein JSR86_14565 [Proteobacteria bacterium]|nr:hypothetical protein [Pseudomonadota bacterium]
MNSDVPEKVFSPRLDRAGAQAFADEGALPLGLPPRSTKDTHIMSSEDQTHGKPPTEIHFKVDNEPETTTEPLLTPNYIIQEFGRRDPSTNYLVKIKGRDTDSYQGKGDIPIEVKNGDHFQCVSVGPTPVSDTQAVFGVAAFIAGLAELGFEANTLSGEPDHVWIDYEVPTGRLAGQKVRLGFIVPGDFPVTPPTGPHVSPRVWPINPGAQHPERAHESASFGPAWEYWSRPISDWARSRTVAAYMAHVWRLWHTQ